MPGTPSGQAPSPSEQDTRRLRARSATRTCPTCGSAPLAPVRETPHALVLNCPRCGANTFYFASA